MKELSLHLLDIAQNSVAAEASRIDLELEENVQGDYILRIRDNGRGMSAAFLEKAADPFTTTRTTRRVGLGLPLLRMMAEQTGGGMEIESQPGVGTTVTARFCGGHIDCIPPGDISSSVALLIQGAPEVEWTYTRRTSCGSFTLDTRQLREILGPDIPLSEPAVTLWIEDYIREQEQLIKESEP